MKTTIDKHGRLYIVAETDLEAYALGRWCFDHQVQINQVENILFDYSLEILCEDGRGKVSN